MRDLVDQILRHGELQTRAADQDGHRARIARKEHRGLPGGVAPTHDEDVFADYTAGLHAGGSVEHTPALQTVDAFRLQPAPVHAGSQHHAAGGDAVSTVELDAVAALGQGKHLLHLAGDHDLGPETRRLLHGPFTQLIPRDAVRKSEVVLNAGRRAGLSSHGGALHYQGAQPL